MAEGLAATPDPQNANVYNCFLETKYFSHTVHLLMEEYTSPKSLEETKSELLGLPELRGALAGVVFLAQPGATEYLPTLKTMKTTLNGFCAVATHSDTPLAPSYVQFEDAVTEHGLELVNLAQSGRNEFMEKLGFDRLRELLECQEWVPAKQEMSLQDIMQKLDHDKQHVLLLPQEEQKLYVDDLVDHYMEYF